MEVRRHPPCGGKTNNQIHQPFKTKNNHDLPRKFETVHRFRPRNHLFPSDPERVLYNMPQPTHVQLWDGQRNILQKFTSAGWAGGKAATKYEKTVNLNRVKAELGFSAANYFSMVYEKVSSLVNTHMDDLSGTELEQAETALFKQALAENIRVTTTASITFPTRRPRSKTRPMRSSCSTSCGPGPIPASRASRPTTGWPTSSRRTSTASTRSTSMQRAPTRPTPMR